MIITKKIEIEMELDDNNNQLCSKRCIYLYSDDYPDYAYCALFNMQLFEWVRLDNNKDKRYERCEKCKKEFA